MEVSFADKKYSRRFSAYLYPLCAGAGLAATQHIPPAGRRWAYLRVAGAGEVGWINIFLKSKYFVRRGRRLARFCCQNTRNEYIYVKVLLQAMMQTFLLNKSGFRWKCFLIYIKCMHSPFRDSGILINIGTAGDGGPWPPSKKISVLDKNGSLAGQKWELGMTEMGRLAKNYL